MTRSEFNTDDFEAEKIHHWTNALQREFRVIQYDHKIKLDPIQIEITDTNRELASWDEIAGKINISRSLINNYSWTIVLEVFKHELAHKIVSEVYRMDEAHGMYFQKACDRIGVDAWARSSTVDLAGSVIHWKDQKLSPEQDRLKRKTEKLLALATSACEAEASLAMEKVRSLYSMNRLNRIDSAAPEDFVTLVINHKKKRLEPHQVNIAGILTRHFFVKTIYAREFDQNTMTHYKIIHVSGTRENVTMAEYVYWFLNNNITSLWNVFKKEHNAKGIAARNSYFFGVLSAFSEKLKKQSDADATKMRAQDQTNSRNGSDNQPSNKLIAIADNQLKTYIEQKFPRLVTRQAGSGSIDVDFYLAGQEDGANLTLNKGIHNPSNQTSATPLLE